MVAEAADEPYFARSGGPHTPASRRLRVRRGATTMLAAVMFALAAGGSQAHRSVESPPGGTPSATRTPAPPGTPPSSAPLAVHPSPRVSPLPVEPLDDPITAVDWYRAEITLPPSARCPGGRVQFARFENGPGMPDSARAHAGGKVIAIYPDGPYLPELAYGDLTGDGRIEAIMEGQCVESSHSADLPTGPGGRLLAVTRTGGGTLTGLGWVGPPGAEILSVWVSGGRLLIVGEPGATGPEGASPALPGLALSYRWDGERFAGWAPAADYPPILPLDASEPGPPVAPRAVATALGCPDAELRFTREVSDRGGAAAAAGASFVIPPQHRQQFLFDLDNTGERLLVTALECTGPDGVTRSGLAVFERAGAGWQGISVLLPPGSIEGTRAHYWEVDGEGRLVVDWSRETSDGRRISSPVPYRWTGTELIPVDG